eukprot:TRINITY_DN16687_c0_g1_i1.p1 TRINITY_DN16687_c0_g1~~TRINITY_DN16687_c0_g1_i1.p1  ORF type:complete len:504 (+),score=202.82 TRINITY_DN16687_c0_g1_i1:87-1514(+)
MAAAHVTAAIAKSDFRDSLLKFVQCWCALGAARAESKEQAAQLMASVGSVVEARSWLWLGRSLSFQAKFREAWAAWQKGDTASIANAGQMLAFLFFFALDNLRLLAKHRFTSGDAEGFRTRSKDFQYLAYTLAVVADLIRLAKKQSAAVALSFAKNALDLLATHVNRYNSAVPQWLAPLCGLVSAVISLHGAISQEAAAAARPAQKAPPAKVTWAHGKRLQDRCALVTGSSSGIGRGVALQFAREGAHVALNYPTGAEQERLHCEALAEEIGKMGRKAIICPADVSDERQVAAMVGKVISQFGKLDILVNNAGIANAAPIEDMAPEMWDRLMAINLRGVFLCTRAVLPHMYQRAEEPGNWHGKIINTTSQLAYKGAPAFSHYTASKGAMLSFTRSLSLEIGKRRVRANCVGPGACMTPILAGVPQEVLDGIVASIPSGRMATVDDVTPAYVYLASDESNHVVGQCISPNGGDMFL